MSASCRMLQHDHPTTGSSIADAGAAKALRWAALTALACCRVATIMGWALLLIIPALLNWHASVLHLEVRGDSELLYPSPDSMTFQPISFCCRYMMGVILAGGKCGAVDEEAAAQHWHAAALQGDTWSTYRLATLSHLAKSEVDLTSSGSGAPERVESPRRAAAETLIHAQASRPQVCCAVRSAKVTRWCRRYS